MEKQTKLYGKVLVGIGALIELGIIAEGTKMTSEFLTYYWGTSKSWKRKLICLAGGLAINDILVDKYLLTPVYKTTKKIVEIIQDEDEPLDDPADDDLVTDDVRVKFKEEEDG